MQAVQTLSAPAQSLFDSAAPLAARALPREKAEVEHASAMFEKLFASLLVKEMRSTLGDGFFGQGPGSDVFGGWLDEHLGSALCDGPGLGLASSLREGLLQRRLASSAENQRETP